MKTILKKGITGLEFLLIHAVVSGFLLTSTEILTDGGISKLGTEKTITVSEKAGTIKSEKGGK